MKTSKGFAPAISIKSKTVDFHGATVKIARNTANNLDLLKLADLNKHCDQPANRRYEDVQVYACIDQHDETAFYIDGKGVNRAMWILSHEGNVAGSRLQSKMLDEGIKGSIDHKTQMMSIPGTNTKLKLFNGKLMLGDVAAILGLTEAEMIAEMNSPEFQQYAKNVGIDHLM